MQAKKALAAIMWLFPITIQLINNRILCVNIYQDIRDRLVFIW